MGPKPTVRDGGVEGYGRFVRPAASHVTDGVAASTQHQQRKVEAFHVLHTLGVAWAQQNNNSVSHFCVNKKKTTVLQPLTFDGEVEAAEAVAWQRVGSTLQHHGAGLVHLHHLGHDLHPHQHRYLRLILILTADGSKLFIFGQKTKQNIVHSRVWKWLRTTRHQCHPSVGSWRRSIYPFLHQCPADRHGRLCFKNRHMVVVFWLVLKKPHHFQAYPQVSCAGEILSVLVEGHGHDTVRGVEGFLHTVSMMDVNIYVQNPLVVPAKTMEG